MSKLISILLCTILLLTTSLSAIKASKEANITCSSGSFQIGSQATVTCHFHIDVGAQKQSFYVEHIPVNSANVKDPKYVVNCNFDDQGTHCLPRTAVKGSVTDQVELNLGNVSRDSGGIYRCRFVDLPATSAWCMLSVLKDSKNEDDKSDAYHMLIAVVVALSMAVLILTMLYVATIVFIRRHFTLDKRRLEEKKKASDETTNPDIITSRLCHENETRIPASSKPAKQDGQEVDALLDSTPDFAAQPAFRRKENIDHPLSSFQSILPSISGYHPKPDLSVNRNYPTTSGYGYSSDLVRPKERYSHY